MLGCSGSYLSRPPCRGCCCDRCCPRRPLQSGNSLVSGSGGRRRLPGCCGRCRRRSYRPFSGRYRCRRCCEAHSQATLLYFGRSCLILCCCWWFRRRLSLLWQPLHWDCCVWRLRGA
jgi:hypothetical protein